MLLAYGFQYLFLTALAGEIDSTFNQGQMRIRLREIPKQAFGLEINILTKETQMVAVT